MTYAAQQPYPRSARSGSASGDDCPLSVQLLHLSVAATRLSEFYDRTSRVACTVDDCSGRNQACGTAATDTSVARIHCPPRDTASPAEYLDQSGIPEAHVIRTMIRTRQLRGRYLDESLFADPAWDMLLDLCAAYRENVPVYVTSLCVAAAVPQSTALRMLRTLSQRGLVTQTPDRADRRRVIVALSEQGIRAMEDYFDAVRKASCAK